MNDRYRCTGVTSEVVQSGLYLKEISRLLNIVPESQPVSPHLISLYSIKGFTMKRDGGDGWSNNSIPMKQKKKVKRRRYRRVVCQGGCRRPRV